MKKSVLQRRIDRYNDVMAGQSGGRGKTAVDTRGYHKPGSNKK